MNTPSVDIIVPVWNAPCQTRACLAAILKHSPNARLIIVANGSSRETELMLEEFSEPLGERGLFIFYDKNIGLVPAINRGLLRSDSDYVLIMRPNITVTEGWLEKLLQAAEAPEAGIVTPTFYGDGQPRIETPVKGCSLLETCSISFSTLLLKGEMRMLIGMFDENLDGTDWCLYDYIHRARERGYRTYCSLQPKLFCEVEIAFGSAKRKEAVFIQSKQAMGERWGVSRTFCVYCGKKTTVDELSGLKDYLLQLSRQGNRCILLLPWRQYGECLKRGWNALHIGLSIKRISFWGAEKNVTKIYSVFKKTDESCIALRGVESVSFPGVPDAPYWEDFCS